MGSFEIRYSGQTVKYPCQFCRLWNIRLFVNFFQAEDGIRDLTVTGVQTCALPISRTDESCSPGASARTNGKSGTSTPPRVPGRLELTRVAPRTLRELSGIHTRPIMTTAR